MTREELLEFIYDDLQRVLKIFESKNQAYGNDRDGFYNFRETARRLGGQAPTAERIFGVLLTLADKHWVALMQGGTRTDEAADRLLDVVVYALIGRAMLAEIGKNAVSGEADPWELEELVG